jgi:hypothetical protein
MIVILLLLILILFLLLIAGVLLALFLLALFLLVIVPSEFAILQPVFKSGLTCIRVVLGMSYARPGDETGEEEDAAHFVTPKDVNPTGERVLE